MTEKKTDKGVTFSQHPCGKDAEKREMGPAKPADEQASAEDDEDKDFLDLGEEAWVKATGPIDEVLTRLGAPAARYRVDTAEYWLYDQVGRTQNGQRQLIELLVNEGRGTQVNWLSEEVMKSTIEIAREIGDWSPAPGPRAQKFYATGEDIRGLSKVALSRRFGEPDAKKIFNGTEVWEYRDVPMSPYETRRMSVFVEFEGDRVRQSMAN